MRVRMLVQAALMAALSTGAFAAGTGHSHDDHPHDGALGHTATFGEPCNPKAKERIVQVDMLDNGTMRFSPAKWTIKLGETIRFNVRNRGVADHELMLGTVADLEEHAKLMQQFPEMEHAEPFAVSLPPGKNGVILWKFTKVGQFAYGCLKPGHFEAGMKGTIVVNK